MTDLKSETVPTEAAKPQEKKLTLETVQAKLKQLQGLCGIDCQHMLEICAYAHHEAVLMGEETMNSESETVEERALQFLIKRFKTKTGGFGMSREAAIEILAEFAHSLPKKPHIYRFPEAPESCPECDSTQFVTAGGQNLVCLVCFLTSENDRLSSLLQEKEQK